MSLRDSEALISKWHLSVGRDLVNDEDIDRLGKYERELIRALRDRPPIRNLASNPLLCSMMCVLNWDRQQRLPDNRMELYGLALEMLVDARDAERGVRAARLSELDRLAKEALLDGLAYWMMRNGATEADRGDVENSGRHASSAPLEDCTVPRRSLARTPRAQWCAAHGRSRCGASGRFWIAR